MDPALQDPGLPRKGPTTPFWQIPLHSLADITSPSLPNSADVIIIGSGMTGCSVAKTLLESDPNIKVTVLEARGLASGATSRNGGHIVSPSSADFLELIEAFGLEAAKNIAEFTQRNIEKTFEMVEKLQNDEVKKDSKIRRTERVMALVDKGPYARVKETLRVWNKEMPHLKESFTLISAKEAKERFGLKNTAGAVVATAAAVWPYRLWCGVWDDLHQRFNNRLSIETNTPALSVSVHTTDNNGHEYTVATPRGEIRASHVVHCTNAFAPHLLPALRGKLFPIRGTMSAQDLGSSVPNLGSKRSWSFVGRNQYDIFRQAVSAGLYYLTQDPDSGYMMLGGEFDKPENIVSSDDRTINPISAKKLLNVLPRYFVGSSRPILKSVWSGIMGYTRDGQPIVGRVPESISGRPGRGEWIAAGFNGYGTGYCLSCGQFVAEMILGMEVSNALPVPLLLSEERLAGSLTKRNALDRLLGAAGKR